VFGIKPPPPPVRPEDIKPPIPDINLTGITTILGNKRALLKVPAKPPKQPKEESYILTEGQSEGDIEVLQIDEVAGSVKVNNHGTVQTLDFASNGVKPAGGSAPGTVGAPLHAPGQPLNIPGSIPGGLRQIPPRPIRPPSDPAPTPTSAALPGSSPAYAGTPNTANSGAGTLGLGTSSQNSGRLEDSQQFTHGLSGPEQLIAIKLEHDRMVKQGEDPNMLPGPSDEEQQALKNLGLQ
jgi:hypothetical protein